MSKREKARNFAHVVVGRAKAEAGVLTDDDQLEMDGQKEQANAKVKQVAQKVKDALKK